MRDWSSEGREVRGKRMVAMARWVVMGMGVKMKV